MHLPEEAGPATTAPAPESAPGARAVMLREVMEGLRRPQKETPPKYFYDARGSALFDRITDLPEYYLTRTERSLLASSATPWVREMRPASLVELGAGSARKTRLLLDALEPGALFVPLDVNEGLLRETTAELRGEYPDLRIEYRVTDIGVSLAIPGGLPQPTLCAFLGSTLGNFARPAAVRLLARIRSHLGPRDALLLGVDLRPGSGKSVARLEAAYDDAAGVTAEFNLNVLSVFNRELGADFDLGGFGHAARYDPEEGRIEMHLVARTDQVVRIPGGGTIGFHSGESIRTEISSKYDRPSLQGLFAPAGLELSAWVEDPAGLYALALGRPA